MLKPMTSVDMLKPMISTVALLVCVSAHFWAEVNADRFHPNKSRTFENTNQQFQVEYLDSASLKGFVAEDVVAWGDYTVRTRFGCVTQSTGHDWAQADGIVGMGFPTDYTGRTEPLPLFWALAGGQHGDKKKADGQKLLPTRMFTIMLSNDRGEVMLGGRDPKSVKGASVTLPVRPSLLPGGRQAFMHYTIDVSAIRLGNTPVLNFKQQHIAIEAILDSGTSCIVLPDDDFGGGLTHSPYEAFHSAFQDQNSPDLVITVGGLEVVIPYQDYIVNERTCVMKMDGAPRSFLLGDVFFKRTVVTHDLRDPAKPLVHVGMRDPSYELVQKPVSLLQEGLAVHRAPLVQQEADAHSLQQIRSQAYLATASASPTLAQAAPVKSGSAASAATGSSAGAAASVVPSHGNRVPLATSNSYIYYAQLSVGSPAQSNIRVIVDTGSSVFAIFSVPHNQPSAFQVILLIAAGTLGFAAVSLLVMSWFQDDRDEYEVIDDEEIKATV